MIWVYVAHWAAGLVVLAEALNKLERADVWNGRHTARERLGATAWLLVPWAWQRARVVTVLKVAGWMLLSIGSAAALVAPLIHLDRPSVEDACVLVGFAVLVVRSRVREG